MFTRALISAVNVLVACLQSFFTEAWHSSSRQAAFEALLGSWGGAYTKIVWRSSAEWKKERVSVERAWAETCKLALFLDGGNGGQYGVPVGYMDTCQA